MQITQWHKGTDKPVRDGVYQREYRDGIKYSLFKNDTWMFSDFNFYAASRETSPSLYQDLKWRGVTKP